MSAAELTAWLDAVVRVVNPRASRSGGDGETIERRRYIVQRRKKAEGE